jgi:hypothetical protein
VADWWMESCWPESSTNCDSLFLMSVTSISNRGRRTFSRC